MSVLFAALLGGFALGQAAPNIQFFAAGKVAGGRVLGMIDRCCPAPHDTSVQDLRPGSESLAQHCRPLASLCFSLALRRVMEVLEDCHKLPRMHPE